MKAQRVIYFETVRGLPTPEIYHQMPEFPRFEIDLRILDENGYTIHTQMGGDGFIDPTWEADMARDEERLAVTPVSIADRNESFQMVHEAAVALEQAAIADDSTDADSGWPRVLHHAQQLQPRQLRQLDERMVLAQLLEPLEPHRGQV